jgi:hypothetical protein
VHELYGRLEDMRGGNRNASIEPELNRVGEDMIHAPDEQSFLAGLSFILKQVEKMYREHLDAADSSANALEIRNLETARFEWPAPIEFDDRLHHADLGTYESKVSLPLEERAIGEFGVYFNEFYAAALLATIIYDSWKMNAPRQYYMDIAHHFWDEVRHAEFGAIRLRELGVEPSKVNMVLFEQSQHMPLLHRLCYLTLGLEVFSCRAKASGHDSMSSKGMVARSYSPMRIGLKKSTMSIMENDGSNIFWKKTRVRCRISRMKSPPILRKLKFSFPMIAKRLGKNKYEVRSI